MKKIPTVFIRDWDNNPKYVTKEPNPECAWVFAGEGAATRKYDGTCMWFDGQRWWARREVKKGKQPPANFTQVAVDEETGKTVGWEPIEQSGFAKWHAEAIREAADADYPEGANTVWYPGTYELVGPKINGNPEGEKVHTLLKHEFAEKSLDDRDHGLRTYEDIRFLVLGLAQNGWEGIVYHRSPGDPNTEMAKIKARDFPREAE